MYGYFVIDLDRVKSSRLVCFFLCFSFFTYGYFPHAEMTRRPWFSMQHGSQVMLQPEFKHEHPFIAISTTRV
jgi:hypothetical protein